MSIRCVQTSKTASISKTAGRTLVYIQPHTPTEIFIYTRYHTSPIPKVHRLLQQIIVVPLAFRWYQRERADVVQNSMKTTAKCIVPGGPDHIYREMCRRRLIKYRRRELATRVNKNEMCPMKKFSQSAQLHRERVNLQRPLPHRHPAATEVRAPA